MAAPAVCVLQRQEGSLKVQQRRFHRLFLEVLGTRSLGRVREEKGMRSVQ